MINITMPSIQVQKVANGYVVQWQRKVSGPQRIETMTEVCSGPADLVAIIERAAKEVGD